MLIPAYLLAWLAGIMTNGEITTAKGSYYFHGDIAMLGLGGLLVLTFGTVIPIRPSVRGLVTISSYHVSPRLLTAYGVLSIVGYVYWFKDFLLHPMTIWSAILHGGSITYALRNAIEKSAGIASLAQLGLPYIILYSYTRWTGAEHLISKVHKSLLLIIVISVLFRVFAWGERVALIEAIIAIGFIWVTFAEIQSNRLRRLIPWLPVFGGGLTVILFAVGEYFRSWVSFYHLKGIPFWQFILQRLTNYYFTALNTGAGRLQVMDWPTYTFEWTLRWVHKLPFFGPAFSSMVGAKPDYFLERYADPEFNNPSGIFSIYYDLGIVAGFSLLFLVGVLSRYLYSYWRYGSNMFGCVYFLFLISYMEMFRYFYLGDSRCFMVAIGLFLAQIFKEKGRHSEFVAA